MKIWYEQRFVIWVYGNLIRTNAIWFARWVYGYMMKRSNQICSDSMLKYRDSCIDCMNFIDYTKKLLYIYVIVPIYTSKLYQWYTNDNIQSQTIIKRLIFLLFWIYHGLEAPISHSNFISQQAIILFAVIICILKARYFCNWQSSLNLNCQILLLFF
jgi:hypothetical protein